MSFRFPRPATFPLQNSTEKVPRAVFLTLGYAMLILSLLQIWRPYYFLTDDNLTGALPVLVNSSRRLWAGKSPFVNEYLFGGNYNLLHDASALGLWNPFNLLASVLVKTGGYFAMVDVFCSLNLLLCAGAFSLLLCRLKEKWFLESLSVGRIVFLSLSFTFSTYTLMIGASWLTFLSNQAALPILCLGLLELRRARGILLVALGLSHAVLAGHLSPFLFTLLFFTVFAIGLCWSEKSSAPLLHWIGGGLVALVIVMPFLIPAIRGFAGTERNLPLTIKQISVTAVPLPILISSFFVGSLSAMSGVPYLILGKGHQIYDYAIASCAACFLFFHGLKPARKLKRQERLILSLLLLIVLFVVRPLWLSAVLIHMPLFRSLRWPFREILFFQFFIHLWMASRPVTLPRKVCRLTTLIGVAIYLFPFLVSGPPTLSPMGLDQQLVISGQAQEYWDQLKTTLGPNDHIVGAAHQEVVLHNLNRFPFVLLGGFNYPSLFQVPSISGYWITGFKGNPNLKNRPFKHYGLFEPEVAARLQAKDPHLKVLTLVSLKPLRIEISDRHSKRLVVFSPQLTEFLAQHTHSERLGSP